MKRFWLVLLALITSIVFIPALSAKFWWVDDGYSILTAQRIIDSLTHFNLEGLSIVFAGGRFFIVYWIYQAFEYLIGGYNPTVHFVIHYFVILLTTCLIYVIVRGLTKSNLSAFFSGILYVLVPLNTENLFRLGPQEPLLGLFMAASVYFLYKNKVTTSIIFLLIVTLIKENGFILWIPLLCLYTGKRFLFKKRDINLEKYCLWGLIFSIPILLNAFFRRSGYSSNYIFDVGQMISNFSVYMKLVNESFSPLLILLTVSFLIRVMMFCRRDKFKKSGLSLLNQGVFLILFTLFVAIMTPWRFFLSRYLMPATVGLVIFMGLEINGIKEMLKEYKISFTRLLIVIFAGYLLIFTVGNMIRTYYYGEKFADATNFIQSMYKDLAKAVPPNGLVLFNFLKVESTGEFVTETGMQLNFLYHRPDIQVAYLNLENLPKGKFVVVGTTMVPEGYAKEIIKKNISINHVSESTTLEKKYPVLTTTGSMLTQAVKKIYKLIFNKTPLSEDGIVAYYYSRDYWYGYYGEKK